MTLSELRTAWVIANVNAFAHVIGAGESNSRLDTDAYSIINGGGHFTDFSKHPYEGLTTTRGGKACGAYQIIPSTWGDFCRATGHNGNFAPEYQDLCYVWLLAREAALVSVVNGNLESAMQLLRDTWVSLPRLGIGFAKQIFEQYGGVTGAVVQPAAPIEEQSIPATPQPKEATMSGIAIALPIIQSLLTMFSGGAQTQLTPLLSQVANIVAPGVVPPVAGTREAAIIDLANNMMATIMKVAGVKNPDSATDAQKMQAAMVVAADPAKIKAVEDDAMTRLEKMGPTFDKLAAQDKAYNEAALTGRNAAMIRQQADTHGTVQVVVQNISAMSWVLIGGLLLSILAAVICKVIWRDMPDYFTTLIALTGPLAGQIMKERGAVIAYYFDGTPSQNAANAINAEIASKK